MRNPPVLALTLLAGLLVPALARPDDVPPPDTNESLRVLSARRLDAEGKLTEALPLYAARAQQTVTQLDRLRYAEALLRANEAVRARGVFEQLLSEVGSIEHGGGTRPYTAAACASTALTAGVPAVAVEYARVAADADRGDAGKRLLHVRALAAAGDVAGARAVLKTLAPDVSGWTDGRRIEFARWQLLTGDVRAARTLLARPVPESVAQMVRDSVQASDLLRRRDWAKAADLLRASERKVPPGLDGERVDRAWRNVQRELRWVRLRRAVALWQHGDRQDAHAEATKAQESDEAYVRSAAVILLAADDFREQRGDDAIARLHVLAGRDYRFLEPVEQLEAALRADDDPGDAIRRLEAAIADQDRSADFITAPLMASLEEAVPRTNASTEVVRLDP